MNQRIVSAAAVLICIAILTVVAIFGYSRYKAAQVDDASFQQQLKTGAANPHSGLGAQMPAQLPPLTSNVDGDSAPKSPSQ